MSRFPAWSIVAIAALEAILPQRFFPPSRLFVATLLFLLSWRLARVPGPILPAGALRRIALLLLLAVSVSGLGAMQTHQALLAGADLFLYLIVLLAVRHLVDREQDPLLLRALAGIGGLCALWALYQAGFGFREALDLLQRIDLPEETIIAERLRSGRVFGTFILPSAFAGYLILALPVTAGLALSGGRRGRIGWGALLALQLWALYATRSQGAALALVLALLLTALRRQPARRRGTILAGGIAAVAVFAAIAAARGGVLLDPADPAGPIGQRFGVWRAAAGMLRDRPLFGVGPGNFGIAFPQYRPPGIDETRYAHNSYLQAAAEAGLWFLVPLALFLRRFARRAARAAGSPDSPGAGVAAAIGCTGFLIHNLVDFTLFLPATAVPFFLLLGVMERRAGGPAGAQATAGGAGPARLLAVAAAGLWGFWLLLHLSDRAIDSALSAREAGDPARSVRAAERAIALSPWRPRPWEVLAGILLESAGADPVRLERARDASLRAVALDPFTPFRHYLAGRIAFALGDDSAAYLSLRRASRLYPLREEYGRALRTVEERILSADVPPR